MLSGPGMLIGSHDCTPGYYNNEGQDPGPRGKLNVGYPAGASAYFRYLDEWVGYPAGASAYFRYLDEWRSSGRFEGLAFRTP